ncbi:hypothetical protein [Paenibacillus sp. GYB003]|uniref:hypothetical protein n=1 Tax=Paenibacillus sp. GYB003 TaxID=2994392 RepID=UPI002F96628B
MHFDPVFHVRFRLADELQQAIRRFVRESIALPVPGPRFGRMDEALACAADDCAKRDSIYFDLLPSSHFRDVRPAARVRMDGPFSRFRLITERY